ncbi:hypothetical protein [Streptomyces sp. B1I3]|uniref:hypothetical protein n=1 Tax=Streptomyces sp. B1I3 TaxID=3042264 RepID=UPI0027D855AB|nr:hypothetical protein [Streptomyces sp. B1I3]
MKLALEAPLKQIAVNGGLEGGVIVEKVRNLFRFPASGRPTTTTSRVSASMTT